MLIGGILESLSISVIIPVVTVLLDPKAVETNQVLAALYHGLGMSSVSSFTTIMMLALIGAFVLKNLFLFLQNVVQYYIYYILLSHMG